MTLTYLGAFATASHNVRSGGRIVSCCCISYITLNSCFVTHKVLIITFYSPSIITVIFAHFQINSTAKLNNRNIAWIFNSDKHKSNQFCTGINIYILSSFSRSKPPAQLQQLILTVLTVKIKDEQTK